MLSPCAGLARLPVDVASRVADRLAAAEVSVVCLPQGGCAASRLRGTPPVRLLRAAGVQPLAGDLDQPATLARLAGLAQRVLHLAPPPTEGAGPQAWWRDPRTEHLLQALARRTLPQALVYASTTGVYGDCGGAWIDETRGIAPGNARGQRRANAERAVRGWALHSGVRATVLRVPGIYALDREGGTPVARLRKGLPLLQASDDVYTNHIHADDLARACVAALWRARPQRIYNASDATELKMGDYFDLAADLYGLPRPPRVPIGISQEQLSLMLLSFMNESRRLDNGRLVRELGVRLRYPTVAEGLRELL
ncbi:MAG TPA: NAD(P)-dependent oxidoreductase [Streptomyces sp.]|nr:NAD(P)-dependent oxidoreductase [Streptomyces sp.]